MDLLIDLTVVLDICTLRKPHAEISAIALETAKSNGARLWLYAGSTQSMEYNLYHHIKRENQDLENPLSNKAVLAKARLLLSEFAKDKHWLAALSEEGPVFTTPDTEDEQLLRSLNRFPSGTIKILTRDQYLLTAHPAKTIDPAAYCNLDLVEKPIDFIDLKTQQDNIRPQLESNLHRVLHHGQYIMGPEIKQLEHRLQDYTGSKHCITVASGTEALLISLMALGIGPGDEVITTPFTFVATAEVIALVGATPVFVDVEPDTCNIDARKIEQAITPRTKAIMPVSLYGQVADMDEINAIAARYGSIPVIEDAAQSFGASYKGKKSCNLSTIGCTSFFPSKPLGCYGDGGAIFTNDDQLALAMREIRVHGQQKRYFHTRVGVGGRMDTLQAAVVLAKMDSFDQEVEMRNQAGERYLNLLQGFTDIQPIRVKADRICVWGQFTVQAAQREQLIQHLSKAQIPSAVHYPVPLHQQPAYQGKCRISGSLEVAEQVAARVMSLPMYPEITLETQQRVIDCIRSA